MPHEQCKFDYFLSRISINLDFMMKLSVTQILKETFSNILFRFVVKMQESLKEQLDSLKTMPEVNVVSSMRV